MDVGKILADLRQEREELERAILSLERLAMDRRPRRRGPPSWMDGVEPKRKRGRPLGSKNKKTPASKKDPSTRP
ncbi:MAG: hypothetical protein JWO80_4973 [Bryobacterales bacterium]|nr:hypothetical protein [Bryobacterales bacterium]